MLQILLTSTALQSIFQAAVTLLQLSILVKRLIPVNIPHAYNSDSVCKA